MKTVKLILFDYYVLYCMIFIKSLLELFKNN